MENKEKIVSLYRTPSEWKARYQLETYAPNKEIKGEYDKSLAAHCQNGIFVGRLVEHNIKVWKGIPFAKIPGRFEQSTNPDASNQVMEAYHSGKSCLQPLMNGEQASHYEMSEDECLTLNIYANNNEIKNKPVMVYIHGGGWINGGNCDPLYDGRNFVYYNPDILVVNITYRVGFLGQINLTPLLKPGEELPNKYKCSTNNGILDQIQALRWIKDNIAAFNGDPNNVTICGESAGGGSVSNLVMLQSSHFGQWIKDGERLFKNAISMSGGINQYINVESSKRLATKMQEPWKDDGSGGFGIHSISELVDPKIIPFTRLKKWWENQANQTLINYCTLDGIVLPLDAYQVYTKYVGSDITVLQGATTNEFAYYHTVLPFDLIGTTFDGICHSLRRYITGDHHDIPAQYLKPFTPSDEFNKAFKNYQVALEKLGFNSEEAVRELGNDLTLQGINYYLADMQTRNHGVNYIYAFDKSYDGEYAVLKAAHAVDCFYLFGNFEGTGGKGDEVEVELARDFEASIAAFCRTGDPSTAKHPWKRYDNTTRPCMLINEREYVIKDGYQADRYKYFVDMLNSNERARYVPAWSDAFMIANVYYPKKK
ncbi:MAG: carboxylesterase family protein [Bacilli bacterium]|nr:carboxylesterase family protein [Bacilli bacterium]